MTDNQNQPRKLSLRSGTFIQELTNRFRLIGRLIMDPRVHPLVKLLPIGSLVYVIWPIDVPGPIDDAMILWLGTTLFVELCPQDVVDEHLRSIQRRIEGDQWQGSVPPTGSPRNEDIVDGEYYEKDSNQSRHPSNR